MDNSHGIIIHFIDSSKRKIALLDYHKGRINAIATSQHLSLGSIISYAISTKKVTHFIDDIELLYLPLSLARIDVLFLHHVLEIIYHFAPVESCVSGVFNLLLKLYKTKYTTLTRCDKKLFLLQLFSVLGIVPDIQHAQNSNPLPSSSSCPLDTHTEKKLDKWLWYCIYQHPYVNEFKTMHFLDKNRTP